MFDQLTEKLEATFARLRGRGVLAARRRQGRGECDAGNARERKEDR